MENISPRPVTQPSLAANTCGVVALEVARIALDIYHRRACKMIAMIPASKITNSMGRYPKLTPAWISTLQLPLDGNQIYDVCITSNDMAYGSK